MKLWERIVNIRLATVIGAFAALMPLQAFAQTVSCGTTITDSAGILGQNASQIEESAGALARAGANIHIVVLPDTKASEFASAESSLRGQCATWQGNSRTGRSSSLLLVLVSVPDKRTAIYYGPQWVTKLDPVYQQIARESMNPRFEAGDFAGGLSIGLERLSTAIVPQPVVQQPVIQQTQQTGNSDVGSFLVIIFVCFGGGAVIWFGIVERSGRLKERGKAQKAAVATTDAVTEALSQRLDRIDWDVRELSGQLSEQNAQGLEGVRTNTHNRFGQASGRIAQCGNVNTSILKMGRGGFSLMTRSYQAAQTEATEAIEEAERVIAQYRQLIEQASQKKEAAHTAVAGAEAAISLRTSEFCTTTLENNLALARRRASQADQYLADRDYENARAAATQAVQEATQVTGWANNLPQIAEGLSQLYADSSSSHQQVAEYLGQNRRKVDRSLSGGLTPAKRLLEHVSQRMGDSRPDYVFLTMGAQEARQMTDGILSQAHTQVRAYDGMSDQIQLLTRQAQAAIASVEAQITKTRYTGRTGSEKLATAKSFLEQSQEGRRPLAERHKLVSDAYSAAVDAAKAVGRIRATTSRSANRNTSGGDSGFVFVYSDGGYSGGHSASSSSSGSSDSPSICGGGGGGSASGGGGGCGGGGCGGGGGS